MRRPSNTKWVYVDFDELERILPKTLGRAALDLGHGHDWFTKARREQKPILLQDVRNIQALYGVTPHAIEAPKSYAPKKKRRKATPIVPDVRPDVMTLIADNATEYLETYGLIDSGYNEQHIVNAICTAVKVLLNGLNNERGK